MGVVHKLRPEVLSFILENKQNNPVLSCRNLTQLVLDKFQIKVSKSSINAIFKVNNLSMPIGRRQKQKKKKFHMPALPVIEGVKAIVLVEAIPEISKEKDEEEIVPEENKEKISLEEARLKEAEEWAIKLQEEERIRIEEKLRLEKQKFKDEDIKIKSEEAEVKAHLELVAKLKAEEEARKLALEEARQAAAENKRLEEEARQIVEENKRLEEAKKIEAEKAAQEAELKAEKERWARLAEEELKARQQATKEEVSMPLESLTVTNKIAQDESNSGVILLKALDYLIGGSKEINQHICNKLGNQPEKFFSLTEAVIFQSLSGQKPPQDKLDHYSAAIQEISNIKLDITKIISAVFTEARTVKMDFVDGSIIYLDGRLYSSWLTPHVPYDFSNTFSCLKDDLNRYFLQGSPLVLFSAPGRDIPSREFFNLLLNIGSTGKCPSALTLYGNKLDELESIPLNRENNCSLVFGLWPWQFTGCRKVKRIGDFNLKQIAGLGKDIYLAEIEIDLLQASLNQSLTLKGCAVKTDLQGKILLAILGSDSKPASLDKLAELYLKRWPNFEETSQDFSRKIELLASAGNRQKFPPPEILSPNKIEPTLGLDEIFANYIKMLDAYLRWHFLPAGYSENDFSLTNERFYKIPAELVTSQERITAQLQVGSEYQFLKDLEYLKARLNERQINMATGELLCFESVFK